MLLLFLPSGWPQLLVLVRFFTYFYALLYLNTIMNINESIIHVYVLCNYLYIYLKMIIFLQDIFIQTFPRSRRQWLQSIPYIHIRGTLWWYFYVYVVIFIHCYLCIYIIQLFFLLCIRVYFMYTNLDICT